MSQSFLLKDFGIKGFKLVKTEFTDTGNILYIDYRANKKHRCSVCASTDVHPRGKVTRRFKTVPIGRKPVFISLAIPRVVCLNCQYLRQVKVPFAQEWRRHTKSFERLVIELSACMTIQDIAHYLQVGWETVKEIQKENLQKRFRKIDLKHLKRIAIDEIAIQKGHRYLTIVLDLKSGAVVYVGDGKGADALNPFWQQLKQSKATIEAVAIDMSPAYISAVKDHLPKTTLVFDHFHVVKLFNDKLSEFRRDYHRELTDKMQKKVLKGARWLLLKNPENLQEKKTRSIG